MNNTDENPMVVGAQAAYDATFADGVTCPNCRTILVGDGNKTAGQQLSASGEYCEECVMAQCDTAKNRQQFLSEQTLYIPFLKWAIGQYWMSRLDTLSKAYDEFTHKDAMYNFMDGQYDVQYFAWLMETN
jgi:hypothetical protein